LVPEANGTPNYLIEQVAIHTSQSLSVNAELANRQFDAFDLQLAAIANEGSSVSANFIARNEAGDFQPLPGAQLETERIAALFAPSESRLDLLPKFDWLLAQDNPVNARYLHFATHAEFDRQQPLNAFLYLKSEHHGQPENRLSAWHIMDQLQLQAELVVLSACDSAAGTLVDSEGLISLSRAFQIAGSRNVIAALWEVPDHTNVELMTRLYEALLSGASPSAALRQAQIALLRAPIQLPESQASSGINVVLGWFRDPSTVDARHPFYWANMQLFGPGNSSTD
jgi:CHAT domain-containing protein